MEESTRDAAATSGRLGTLHARLRVGTSDLHAAIERALGPPDSVSSSRGYADLLQRLYDIHSVVETRWGAPGWARARPPVLPTWGAGLGSLYVLEGSSIGGRVLGPAIRAALGPVPTSFLDGAGRGEPHPWRSVARALARFEGDGGDGDEVLLGARQTFVAFGDHIAHTDLSDAR